MARECDLPVITVLIGDRANSQIQLFGFPALQSVLWLTSLLDNYSFLLLSCLYFLLYLVLLVCQNCYTENKPQEEQEASYPAYVKKQQSSNK